MLSTSSKIIRRNFSNNNRNIKSVVKQHHRYYDSHSDRYSEGYHNGFKDGYDDAKNHFLSNPSTIFKLLKDRYPDKYPGDEKDER